MYLFVLAILSSFWFGFFLNAFMEERKMSECCGKCCHHVPDKLMDGEWVCDCADSDYCGCYTDYRDCCEQFLDREDAPASKSYDWGKIR